MNRRRRYGFWAFVFDSLMFILTCGLWGIRIFVREIRSLRTYER